MRRSNRVRISPLAILAAAALALLVLASTASGATHSVTISNFQFTDGSTGNGTSNINAGDTVTWTWGGGTHSTTSGGCSGNNCTNDGVWNSGIMGSGQFSHTFNTAGSFAYHCMVHGAMMQGTVVVQSVSPAPTASFTFTPSNPLVGTGVQFTDTSTGGPTSWLWDFGDPASGAANTDTAQSPTHTYQSAATYTVTLTATNASGSNTTTKTVTVITGGPSVCTPGAQTLCLNGGRFKVTAHYQSDTAEGEGNANVLTDDTGYFWFFTETNVEVIVKVLPFCSAPFNSYWVFSAGLTQVGVVLTVTDTHNGAVYTYTNPIDTKYITDTNTAAFPTSCP